MTRSQFAFCWATVLCLLAVAGWRAVQEQLPGGRRSRLVLAGSGPPMRGQCPQAVRRGWARIRGWLAPELLVLPVGLALGRVTASPVPVLAAALALLPLRRWRLRRRLTVEAGQRAAAVVELCAALAGELRSGATPEQALHLVTARLAEDPDGLRRLGVEPVARLAAGRYGGDVPAALQLLAELPGGSGAAAIAACWRVASDGGSGLAAALDRVAEALRGERALAEEITGELAGPRTTIAVLAALPGAGLLLGSGLGARPLEVLLHTSAGLGCLGAGAVLEGLGVLWTARIVRVAAQGGVEAPQGVAGGRPRAGAEGPAGGGGGRRGLLWARTLGAEAGVG
ncbi:type II secretion system F family protein [Kitasatospora cathayae]|uniref:Type II secretion system F family protein n=1 Tax=Kitasatospora cathayae TaxID=3004092 RepID=A0ABY7Q7C6_9ACTN|nr:type II secretion system F family protein [Kitasatospora sp. HUAS 3-15]WBP88074.1 type II secretion system F family protein [Kitasatospora sp. HUAS 3-15]